MDEGCKGYDQFYDWKLKTFHFRVMRFGQYRRCEVYYFEIL